MIEDTLGVRLQNVQFFICSIRSIIMYQICTVYTYVYVQCMYIYICVCVCVCVCVVPAPEIYLAYIYILCVCVCACDICIQNMHQFYHRFTTWTTVQNPPVQPFPQPWPAVPDATRDKVQEGSATLWDVPWETSHGFPPGHDLEIGGFSMAMLVNDGWWF